MMSDIDKLEKLSILKHLILSKNFSTAHLRLVELDELIITKDNNVKILKVMFEVLLESIKEMPEYKCILLLINNIVDNY